LRNQIKNFKQDQKKLMLPFKNIFIDFNAA
ncbi:hypothetical protein DOY81_005935, partial [Sarcophaga bullata]